MGHLASDCSLSCHKVAATWWKDATTNHLTVKASNSNVFDDSSQEDDDSS